MSSTSTATVGSTSVLWAHDAKRACGTVSELRTICASNIDRGTSVSQEKGPL